MKFIFIDILGFGISLGPIGTLKFLLNQSIFKLGFTLQKFYLIKELESLQLLLGFLHSLLDTTVNFKFFIFLNDFQKQFFQINN